MLSIRKSNERGLAQHGWLKSQHTFSFASYYDPQHMNFGPLRVINEDWIDGGEGFDMHPHSDMEIITYVVSGAIGHQDSMGNGAIVYPGEVQHMSAGTGIRHSEFNPNKDEKTHLLQIWIMPNQRGVKPRYGQKSFEKQLQEQKFVHVISPDGKEDSIAIYQDANMYASRLKATQSFDFAFPKNRRMWVQVIKGQVSVNGKELHPGDALSAVDIAEARFEALADSEFLFFDLP